MVVELLEIETMMRVSPTAELEPHREWRLMILSGALFTALFVVTVTFGGGRTAWLLALPALAAAIVLLRSVNLALMALVAILFLIMPLSWFSSGVWFSALVALSFVVNYRDFAWKEFLTPLTVPLVIYGLAVLPSLANAVNPLRCITLLFNGFAFLTALHVTYMHAKSMNVLRRLTWIFVGMALLNGLVLILASLASARRQYGFAGIMYVDYAGLAVNILAIVTLVTSGSRRILALLAGLLIAVALVLTQTRNAWLSALVTFLFAVGYIAKYPFLAGITRRQLMRYALVAGVFVGLAIIVALALNPAVEGRASEITEAEAVQSGETIVVQSSIITRLMIWHTAMNAFVAHPWIGIGVYGFSQASRLYSTLPPVFYERYVEGMSLHVTYFAVLTETGIVGMAGFLFLLGSMLRLAFRAVHDVVGLQAKRYAVVGLVSLVYIVISMFLTDAWLWGQGVVLWGLIVGLILANLKLNGPAERRQVQLTAQGHSV